jgi:predicted small secreted protein
MKTALVLSIVVAAPIVAAQCNNVQIFTAVGHGETYPGVQRSITTAVCQGISSCGVANIQYPSTSSGNGCQAVEQGIATGRTVITDYVTKCPDSKIVVMGWSQVSLLLYQLELSAWHQVPTESRGHPPWFNN